MDADQFLLGMGNHGLSVQVAANEHRRVEDIRRVAQSLEAVREEERFHSRWHTPCNQSRFMANEGDQIGHKTTTTHPWAKAREEYWTKGD